MKKMRGIIEPFTLGFLIAIIGTSLAFVAHGNKSSDEPDSSDNTQSQNQP